MTRLLAVISTNDWTARDAVVAPVTVARLGEATGFHVVGHERAALAVALAEKVPDRVTLATTTPETELASLRGDVIGRQRFMDGELDRDRLLGDLPLESVRRAGAGTLFWDRLQWRITGLDHRELVRDLPWSEVDEVRIFGGVDMVTAVPGLVMQEARRRGIVVHAELQGPVIGRWAPWWLAGCDAATVGDASSARLLAASHAHLDVTVDGTLAPPSLPGWNERPPGADVLLDAHNRTPRTVIARGLREIADRWPAVKRGILVGEPPTLDLARSVLGDRLPGGPELAFAEGDLVEYLCANGGHVVSFAPWRVPLALSETGAGTAVVAPTYAARADQGARPPAWLEACRADADARCTP